MNDRRAQASPGRTEETKPLYGADLAQIHHQHFGQTAEAAAGTMLRGLRQSGVTRGTIVDLACGSGLLARRALDAGFDVVGIDVSPAMLALARSHADRARLVRGSLWDVPLPPCVAVAAVGEAFNYASEAFSPDGPRLAARLGAIARALRPGGMLLFDVAGPGRSGPTGRREKLWGDDRFLLHLAEVEGAAERELTRTIEIFTPVGDLHRRQRETHRLALYPPEEVAASLEGAGFAVERRETYGEPMDPLPGWHVFVARRSP